MFQRKVSRAVSAALTALVVVALTAASCTPPPPDVYGTPAAPTGAPGTVIKTAATSFGGGDAFRAVAVQYRSTSATGQANAVTGTVVVPVAAWTGTGPRPIVSFAVGTQGLGDTCAPSKAIPGGTLYE